MMHYNLLFYGYYEFGCTTSNNNINDKNDYLKTILAYAKPDILTVNEMYCNSNVANSLLDNALNRNGISYYKRATSSCQSDYAYTMNMLYYNSDKLGFIRHYTITTDIRDINIFKLYSKSNLVNSPDTVFLYCMVAHLKAGSDWEDENERNSEVLKAMSYLKGNFEPGNFLFMGDFNIYKSAENAFQNMINYTEYEYRFYDPINQIGHWHNDYDYANIHTQSTHSSWNDCAASGGMDDRFDFILISESIRDGSERVIYLPGSYKAIGQDGKHFNEAVNDYPTNTSVPPDVLSALYKNSDHLPVYCELYIGENADMESYFGKRSNIEIVTDNVSENIIINTSVIFSKDNTRLKLIDIYGREVSEKSLNMFEDEVIISTKNLNDGLYVILIEQENKITGTGRFVKF